MFDKFGEFDSWEELNEAAAGQKAEGDEKALIELAIENGFDKEDAEDYFDGTLEQFCNPLSAAIAKLRVEEADLKPQDIMIDWLSYIKSECVQDKNFCVYIRKKGKSLKGCIAELLKWSFNHQIPIDKDVQKAAGVSAGRITLGIPGMATAHQIIRKYYKGE